MATEDEAREAADGEEVQVEAADLGTTHLQMNLDRKLSSHEEIKGEAKIMDSTEGLLKVTEGQVLEKAPSAVEVPPEDTPNSTASSLNGHMEEAEISDEKPQENGQKDDEQVEASADGISTDQSNNSNGEEAIDSSGHVVSTTEDISLLKHENEEPKDHYQQEVEGAAVEEKMVHEDTLQTEPTVDAQEGQNLEPAEVTEDTQDASTSCIPHDEVVAEAPAEVQTSLEPNVDDSDALPDATDGNTETEPAKVDKESCPEDEDVAEQTNEIIKLEDQPSKQTDDVDADLVQEEVPKKTDVPEDTIKTEQSDESTNDDQEELNQESPEDTSDPVYAKTEETSHESNVSASEETAPEHDTTAREPALDVEEVQSQGLAEEIADAKEVDTEKTVQQCGVASEEAAPEDNVATIEPSSDIQHLNGVESEEIKVLEDAKAEETSNQSNVIIAEDAAQDKESTEDIQPVQGLEEPKSTGTFEMDEVSNQPQADVLDNLAEEDDAPACQPQVIELEEEAKDTGVAETQEITQQSHVAASEELVTEDNSMAVESGNDDIQQTLEQGSVEVKDTEASETREICHETTISASEEDSAEDVTAEGPTSDAQEVENIESVEEIKSDNTVEASDMATVEEADQENNMLPSEDVPEQQTRELEPEEIQSTEPVEPQGISPSHIVSTSEESTPEDNVTAEPSPDSQAENLESAVTEETKDVKSTDAVAEEETPEEHVQEFKAPVHTPAAKEPELEETRNTDNQMDAAVLENPTHEDNPTASESLVMESPEVSSSEATEGQEMPQTEVTQSEDYGTEENTIASEPKILEPELAEEMRDSEATEPRSISEDCIVSSSEESVPEEDVTAKEPASDIKEVQTEEPELIDEHNDAKAGEISNQISGTIVGETAQENLESATVTEETRDVKSTDAIAEEENPQEDVQEFEAPVDTPPVEEPELEETKNTEPAEVHDNVATNDLPAEEVNNTEATEIAEIQNESGDLTEDVKSNVALADEAAPEEDAKATEATADIPQAQEPEQEEIKDTEPVEVEGDKIASDLAEEEIKDTEAMETELIPDESTSAKITELTNDVKSNVALAEEAAPEEHVTETEATIDIPGAQEPELEEIKNTEPAEVKENISASDLPAEEVKETEVISESTDANISEPTEDAETNVALADEVAPEKHVIATEATDDIPRAQEPELEETKNTEPIEMKENISASDLPAEEVKETEATETEVISESTVANISEPTEDAETNVALVDVAAPDEHAKATEATAAKPQAQDPELEEIKNSEPIEVEDNIIASDLPEEEIKDTEAMETEVIPDESTSAKITELTNDVKSNVALAEEAAPEEHVTETEATIDIPGALEPELEEIKNTEPVEVKENISASDLPAEEVKETESTETEVITESTVANISETTEDAETNVALADVAPSDEHVKATEATADKPQAQDPELEEIKNSEPIEVEDNIIASDLPEEETKGTEAIEPEVIPDESTSAKITELTNDVKSNVALAEEAAPEEHVTETEATIDIPGAQEPELEEIKNTEPVEVKENIAASDLPAEEVKETEVISESTDANISEPTEDAETNVALADEVAPEEHVIATEATDDIPCAQEPELEETKNTEPIEMKENISASDLPAEEVKETEATETEVISESTDANISEPSEDAETNVALADEAAPEENVIATEDEPQMTDIEAARPEPTPNESNVASLEEMATEDNTTILTDVTIQQLQEQEPVEFRDTEATSEEPAPEDNVTTEVSPDTQAENLESEAVTEETRDVQSSDTIAEEETPEEHVQAFEAPVDIPPVEQPELEETKNTEPVEVHDNVMTNDLPAEEVKDTQATEIAEIHNESGDLTEDVKSNVTLTDEAAPDEDAKATEATADIPQVEEPEPEDIKTSEAVEVEDNIIAREMPEEEIKDTEAMETEMIPDESTGANISEITDDVKSNVALADEAAPEEHVIATDAIIDVPPAQEPELEEIKNTEPVEVEENISATDQSAEETEATEATESEAMNESINANNSDATEREEASHPSQDAGLEKVVSESNAATLEPTADIQQVSDLDVVEEMTAPEAINDEEISCKKTEVATLEDQSPTELDEETLVNEINNAEPTEQKDESSDLGEIAAFTTPEGESPTEEDAQTSGEDTVGILNNIEQIKDQSKAVIEHDAIQSADHTNDQDDEQLHNAELQTEVCERSLDVSAIEQPDEDVQKVKDQQQNEDEAIEKQTEEIQSDEQKHDDRSADLTTETLMEPQSSEIGTANLHEDTDVFEPEQALHTPQGSIPSIPDVKVEDSTEIEETPEQENATNNTDTLYADADAEKYNEREKENIEIDAAVAKLSVDEQDGPTDETINEEVGNGMASPIEKDLQKSSDPASSNEEMLENDTTVVHENVEPRVHREERECINKANDDMQAIQASEEEIVDEVEKKQEMQNEDTDVNNDEVQTKPIDEEASELHSNDSTYSKMDDTMSPYAEMEEVEDNKGFSNTSEYVVEKSEQNDVAQDLSIHPKVVEVETNSNEEMATSYTEVTEAVKSDEVIDNKACGADGALSDENLETTEDSRRNLEASSVATASGESMNEDKEHHNLALPAYSEVTERGLLFPEKPLPTESEEHQESQTTKEQDEEDIHEHETGDTEKEEKEDEQSELPVSNFLMNLIMGKENTEPDEAEKKQETTKDDSCLITSQLEENLVPIPTENKVDNKLIFEQGKHNLDGSEETHDSKLESDDVLSTNTHNLEAPVGENNVQGEVSSELVPGGSGLMTELETRDVQLGEKATNSEKGSLNSNLDDSTNPRVSLEDTLEEVRTDLQHESLPEDIRTDAVAGQTLLSRELNTSDEKKLPKDNDDLQSPLGTKREEAAESSITEAESTIEAERETEVEKEEEKHHTTNRGGGPEGQVENLHDNSQKGAQAISDEQTAEITEPVMGTEINLVHEKEISAGSECEEETQSSKLSNSELHNSEKALDIQSDDSSLHINQDKQDEFAGHQIVMEKNNLLDKREESNLHEEQETEIAQESPIKSDGVDKNCLVITEPVIKEENANRTVESHVQTVNTKSSEEQEIFMSQVQERGLEVVSAKEAPEAEEDIVQMAKPEFSTDEEQSSKEDKSNMAGEKTCVEKTKDEAEAKSFTDEVTTKIEEQGEVQKATHNQTRDFNVVLPTEAPGSEESFVDVKTPEFSTDEEQSPKKDESNMAEEKSYEEKTNSTDEAPMKTEGREAGQKASPKKHNILSGVGSKVKHQLAKVKKAIIGKPGHTKSESPKS